MRVNRRNQFSGWPSWRYGPNGESAIFHSEAEVPYGWTKKPGDVWEPPPATPVLDRNQLIADLAERGIVANPTWSAAYMKELLDNDSRPPWQGSL